MALKGIWHKGGILSNVFLFEDSIGNIMGLFCWVNIHLGHIKVFSWFTGDCYTLLVVYQDYIMVEVSEEFNSGNWQIHN